MVQRQVLQMNIANIVFHQGDPTGNTQDTDCKTNVRELFKGFRFVGRIQQIVAGVVVDFKVRDVCTELKVRPLQPHDVPHS
jgi:hypothetical protein